MATLNIRVSDTDLSQETVERVKRNAAARGWSSGKYLSRLVELHERLKEMDARVLADFELEARAS